MGYDDDVNIIRKSFQKKVKLYKDRPEGACWSSVETQVKRFEILLDIANLQGCSLLDFGCGTGALMGYLLKKGIQVDYYGCDIVDEALEIAAQKYPEGHFAPMKNFDDMHFDYILISGIFNNKVTDNVHYYQNIIKQLYKHVNKGMAFNMMSTYVDYYDDKLFYEQPERVFSFIKKEISPYVVLRNDYQVKPGILPFEFAVYIYKKD